ncbi:hypothetical protein PX52LOC_07967 [Limnoglobus roseus]|uniref:Uncharacterized protein n=2 Tax=Limnoglobus roseus TaxID=2598579 RepID=A0A5C1ARR4_9BACT|nr:hypothetical protein PX52LOC_07967 [Limnoglobus roseus]
MSLTMLEPATHEIEGRDELRGEAAEQIRDQLHQHLIDMNELCSQVRSVCDAGGADEELQLLYAELVGVLDQHNGMIAEQLSDMSPFDDLPNSTWSMKPQPARDKFAVVSPFAEMSEVQS